MVAGVSLAMPSAGLRAMGDRGAEPARTAKSRRLRRLFQAQGNPPRPNIYDAMAASREKSSWNISAGSASEGNVQK